MVALGVQSHIWMRKQYAMSELSQTLQTLDSKAHSFAAVLLDDVIIKVASKKLLSRLLWSFLEHY